MFAVHHERRFVPTAHCERWWPLPRAPLSVVASPPGVTRLRLRELLPVLLPVTGCCCAGDRACRGVQRLGPKGQPLGDEGRLWQLQPLPARHRRQAAGSPQVRPPPAVLPCCPAACRTSLPAFQGHTFGEAGGPAGIAYYHPQPHRISTPSSAAQSCACLVCGARRGMPGRSWPPRTNAQLHVAVERMCRQAEQAVAACLELMRSASSPCALH